MEQQTGVDQVNKAVAEMDTVTQHNASLVQESANTSESLLAQAHVLKDTVSFFKLSADDLAMKPAVKESKSKKEKKEGAKASKNTISKEVKREAPKYEEVKKTDTSKSKLKVPPSVEKARAMETSSKLDNTMVKNDEFGATYSSTSTGMTDDGFASF